MSLPVQILTFGCQMNKLDSELMTEALCAAGYEIVADEALAAAIIFNTCAVREHAEERVLQRVRQLKNKRAVVVIAGCAAERLGKTIFAKLPQVRVVCGTRYFPDIADLLARAFAGERLAAIGDGQLAAAGAFAAHSRPRHHGIKGFVSVMRGCDNFCAYCIVPYVRGREESRPAAAIVRETAALAERGAIEITLLGQNIDAYGKGQNSSFAALLAQLDDEISPRVKRFRFVTSHPRDLTEKLARTIADRPRLAAHLHMPAQSGSNQILAKMKRGYTREIYDERLRMIADVLPEASVVSDFIVGFPGETADDFAATVALVEQARFQTAYVFKYSPRPGTWSAENLPDDVPLAVKKERNLRLLKVQEVVSRERHAALIGREVEVLVEGLSTTDATKMSGRTSNNLNVVFPLTAGVAAGDWAKVKVTGSSPLTLKGERV
ncbi:MAG: tRNA (N6-isopentenyl adenosine(37)-C2)-methylthiotransferase MiaB [Planctomycetota bacterium]|jgi:tRNA-2-methylthio-N6-dimethylallyladenosine synthase|nr:tRNA (N6-isopentenyl adenosine(37)-C2)-methylthiotransferase MiaB [Planctomycetota bacterium]